MGKTLVIAEKPSVARDIAKVLGCGRKGDGYIAGDTHVVTWAVGHLVTLCEPEDYDERLKKWRFESLPIIPQKMELKAIDATERQLATLRKLMHDERIDSLVCATDSGREGELIFRYIYEHAGCAKPFTRLWISSMTDEAIREGFSRLRDGSEYDLLYRSARCRSEADWLVGMNATRAFTLRYGPLLSIGRVQTPTLAILVNRQKEIDAFVPEEYCEVKGTFDGFTGMWWNPETKETRIAEKERAEEIAGKVKGKQGSVVDVAKEQKSQPPPLLYDLTELQRDANRRFGFPAQKTLDVAQSLYERKKLITYPRTDSRYLSDDMIPTLPDIVKKLELPPYEAFAKHLLASGKLPVTKRIVDGSKVTDHHAIIPTHVRPDLGSLSDDERKIYHLVATRFLAVFYPPHVFTLTRILSEVERETFLSKGKTIVAPGWMELYRDEEAAEKKARKKEDEEEQVLPDLAPGDGVKVKDAKVLHKKTKPPATYTEGTLLTAMENAGRFVDDEELKEQLKESGIGTPSTRAAVIERLIAVQYVARKGKSLIPTEKGMKLVEIVPAELKSPETTGKWEKGLGSIAKGKLSPEHFMESIVRYVRFIVGAARETRVEVTFPEEKTSASAQKSGKALPSFGRCPGCGKGAVHENSKGYYCSEWRQFCKFTIWKSSLERLGVTPAPDHVRELVTKGQVEAGGVTIKMKSSMGALEVVPPGPPGAEQ